MRAREHVFAVVCLFLIADTTGGEGIPPCLTSIYPHTSATKVDVVVVDGFLIVADKLSAEMNGLFVVHFIYLSPSSAAI